MEVILQWPGKPPPQMAGAPAAAGASAAQGQSSSSAGPFVAPAAAGATASGSRAASVGDCQQLQNRP
eukprot:8854750-Pyramimonas_sp.AAC.1